MVCDAFATCPLVREPTESAACRLLARVRSRRSEHRDRGYFAASLVLGLRCRDTWQVHQVQSSEVQRPPGCTSSRLRSSPSAFDSAPDTILCVLPYLHTFSLLSTPMVDAAALPVLSWAVAQGDPARFQAQLQAALSGVGFLYLDDITVVS